MTETKYKYILYLTPKIESDLYRIVNNIYKQQDVSFDKKYQTIYPPHSTLTSFFTLPSNNLLNNILNDVSEIFDDMTILKIEQEMTLSYRVTQKWMGLNIHSVTLINSISQFIIRYPFMKSDVLQVNYAHLTLVNNYELNDKIPLHSINSIHLESYLDDNMDTIKFNTFEIKLWKLKDDQLSPY